MDEEMTEVSHEELRSYCTEAFQRVGVPAQSAYIAADNLVDANLRGIDSHGVVRLPKYVQGLRKGSINPTPQIGLRQSAKAVLQVDGDNGLGPVIASRAMTETIRICQSMGIAAAGIRRSNHFGTLTYYLLQATKAGLIGFGVTHGESLQVPFGGQVPFFGTNPMAFAFPTRHSPPLMVDFATSATTFGKIMESRGTSQLLPEGLVLDALAKPTRHPGKATRILPMAGHKGYGLAVSVEVLSAILNGSPFGPHVPPVFRDDFDQPGELGHFFITIDPGCFYGRETYYDQIEKLIEELHDIAPADGFRGVLVPGEPESRTYARRVINGVPLRQDLLQKIKCLARD